MGDYNPGSGWYEVAIEETPPEGAIEQVTWARKGGNVRKWYRDPLEPDTYLGSGDTKASYILNPDQIEVLNDALTTAWYVWQDKGGRGTDELDDLMAALGWTAQGGEEDDE